MEKSFFENEEYRIENGTLINYLGDKKKIGIPSQVAGYKIKSIGGYAFGSKQIDTLILREGIEKIEEGAFARTNIKNLILPSTINRMSDAVFFFNNIPNNIVVYRSFSQASWNRLRNNCISTVTGSFLLRTNFTEDEVLSSIFKICDRQMIDPCIVNEDMMTLFTISENREDIVFNEKKIKSQNLMTEYLIRNEIFASVSQEVDDVDDYNFRNAGSTRAQDVILCKVCLDDCNKSSDCVRLKFHFVKGIYYWLRIEKIILEGKKYYISSKEFLNPNDRVPYIKKVENVYDETEFKVKDETRKLVLRKYNFLRNIP